MEINFKEDSIVWDRFVDGSPHRSIFVKTEFLDLLGASYDLVTCREGEKVLAGAVILFGPDGQPLHSAHKFTQYQGLMLADNSSMPPHSKVGYEFKIVEFFIAELVKKYKRFFLCQHWRFGDMRPFQWFNYHRPEEGTFKLDLRYTPVIDKKDYENFPKFLSAIRRNRKREYVKAKEELTMENTDDIETLDRLHEEVFRRQGIERNSSDSMLVKSITEGSLAAGFGSLMFAKKGDRPVSALLALRDNRSSFFLFGATETSARDDGGYTYLSLEMIKNAFDGRCLEVDICGANSPQRSDYKMSFNAELRPYFQVYYPAPKKSL